MYNFKLLMSTSASLAAAKKRRGVQPQQQQPVKQSQMQQNNSLNQNNNNDNNFIKVTANELLRRHEYRIHLLESIIRKNKLITEKDLENLKLESNNTNKDNKMHNLLENNTK